MTSINFAEAPTIETERLRLRAWRESDLAPYAAMGADPEVMRYFPDLMSEKESLDHVADLQERQRNWGFTFWAVESDELPFAGFVGLSRPKIEAHFTPCVEVGWRLARQAWGKGYATEGGRAALEFGFAEQGFDEIVAMVSTANAPSRRVAERLGMNYDPADDFVFPAEEMWPYADSVLYRISREKFMEQGSLIT